MGGGGGGAAIGGGGGGPVTGSDPDDGGGGWAVSDDKPKSGRSAGISGRSAIPRELGAIPDRSWRMGS